MAYSGSKDFKDYYVTQGTAADDLNAGTMYTGGGQTYTNDGPCETFANCDVAAGAPLHYDIDNNNGGAGWGTTSIGDAIRIDTAGTAELGQVTALSVGGDDDVIEVGDLTVGGITVPVNAKNCNVGGAFEHAQAAADLIEWLSYNFALGPPRVNIKRHAGTPYVEAFDIDTNAGTKDVPITFAAYNTIPGDIDPMVDTDMAVFRPDAAAFAASGSTGCIDVDVPFYRLLNLDCETAVAATHGIFVRNLGDQAVLLNCRAKGVTYSMYWEDGAAYCTADRCLVEDATSHNFYSRISTMGRITRCIIRGGASNGLTVYGDRALIAGNHIYDNTGNGILALSNLFLRSHVLNNTIADNGGDGIDLGTEVDLESNVITNNIIAHNVGWAIAGTGANARFALLDYNMIYGNTAGAVQDIEAGGTLIDDSEHDNETDAPFTGANAGARAANFYELTTEARQIQQLFADDDFTTYPDAGAAQAIAGAIGRGFLRGTA